MDQTIQTLLEEARIYDVVIPFRLGASIAEIADDLQISRQKAVSLLQQAFGAGLVNLSPNPRSDQLTVLNEYYPGVVFSIIAGRYWWHRLAAEQVLQWIRDLHGLALNQEAYYVAIGGGETMLNIAQNLGSALAAPGRNDLRRWFSHSERVKFINATSGGKPDVPKNEASHIACLFQDHTDQKGLGYSLGTTMKNEVDQIRAAINTTRLVISGVGTDSAYCVTAMKQRGVLKPEQLKMIAGEFLFHPFTSEGQPVFDPTASPAPVLVLENVKSGEEDKIGNHMFATLFQFSRLIPQPDVINSQTKPSPRDSKVLKTAAVAFVPLVSDSQVASLESKDFDQQEFLDRVDLKAKALHILLRRQALTHVCISSDLALRLVRCAVISQKKREP